MSLVLQSLIAQVVQIISEYVSKTLERDNPIKKSPFKSNQRTCNIGCFPVGWEIKNCLCSHPLQLLGCGCGRVATVRGAQWIWGLVVPTKLEKMQGWVNFNTTGNLWFPGAWDVPCVIICPVLRKAGLSPCCRRGCGKPGRS